MVEFKGKGLRLANSDKWSHLTYRPLPFYKEKTVRGKWLGKNYDRNLQN